jgi:hypothetical protein
MALSNLRLVRSSWRQIVPLGLVACLAIGSISLVAADATIATDSLRQAHRLLRELDRFLDHNPLLEDDLRFDPGLVAAPDYLGKHAELQSFLDNNPGVVRALQLEPRHFLHRALMREADAPLKYAEVAQLDPFFAAEPAIERQIVEDPTRIRDRDYLILHPSLDDFLAQHPLLNRVFEPETVAKL